GWPGARRWQRVGGRPRAIGRGAAGAEGFGGMTPVRAMLIVVVIGSAALALYGLLIDNSGVKLPLVVSSLAVLGFSLGLLSFIGAAAAIRSGEEGRVWRALGLAFVGGLGVLIAAGSLAGALILGILTGTA